VPNTILAWLTGKARAYPNTMSKFLIGFAKRLSSLGRIALQPKKNRFTVSRTSETGVL
jgi:hypothetical protein